MMLDVGSPADAAEVTAAVLTRVNTSVHGLWLAFSEAARHDPALAEALRALAARIRAQHTVLMEEWSRRGYLREDRSFDDLVERAVLIGSVEMYDRAVRIEGEDVPTYTRALSTLIADSLLAG